MADENGTTTTAAPATVTSTTPVAPVEVEAPKPATGDELGENGKKALEAEREARKAKEREAADAVKREKALQKQLEELQRGQMGEQEKQVADAEARGRAAAVQDIGKQWVAAELRASAAEAGADATQTEFWDMTRFVSEDGTPNVKAITEAVGKLPKKTPETPPAPVVPSFDGGTRPLAKASTTPGMGTLEAGYAEKNPPRRRT
jgi:aspartokinase